MHELPKRFLCSGQPSVLGSPHGQRILPCRTRHDWPVRSGRPF